MKLTVAASALPVALSETLPLSRTLATAEDTNSNRALATLSSSTATVCEPG